VDGLLWNDRNIDALGEASRLEWFGGKRTQAEWDAFGKLLRKKLNFQPLPEEEVKTFTLLPFDLPKTPYASPLRFNQKGLLWAQTKDGLRPADPSIATVAVEAEEPSPERPSTTDDHEAGSLPRPAPPPAAYPAAPKKWSLLPRRADGALLQAVLPSCGRAEIQLALLEDPARPPRLQPLPILAPRPANCASFGKPPLEAEVIGWKRNSLHGISAGQLFFSQGVIDQNHLRAAYLTRWGLVVIADSKLTVFTSDKLPPSTHHCVITPKQSTNQKVACLTASGIIEFNLEQNTERSSPESSQERPL
ncbi:MAG: hypothetical protein MK135_11380, partial [Polyangiaceae bacterium]|nr:hypothetical protein [Polyangiaceae bacterium]